LILHQGDERRHDYSGALQVKGRKLIAERLAGTGGHHGEGIVAVQHRPNNVFLPRTELGEPKGAPE
jgi:hypothetical protein